MCVLKVKYSFAVCWADNVAYSDGDIIPSAGPCEECVCSAPDVVCSMVKCEIKTGCKIIQKPNQCCPDYKCGKIQTKYTYIKFGTGNVFVFLIVYHIFIFIVQIVNITDINIIMERK